MQSDQGTAERRSSDPWREPPRHPSSGFWPVRCVPARRAPGFERLSHGGHASLVRERPPGHTTARNLLVPPLCRIPTRRARRLSLAKSLSGQPEDRCSGGTSGISAPHEAEGGQPLEAERSPESPTGQPGQISPSAPRLAFAEAGQAARRSCRWCRPPTSGNSTILPMLGGWMAGFAGHEASREGLETLPGFPD